MPMVAALEVMVFTSTSINSLSQDNFSMKLISQNNQA